ncbi:hypothetical protein FAZ19_05485 [Sphingobacterium alkalisoli]|uniref:Uncharacterized protein n=1 Tax=Sphingobacterium alkalisoli TaxID=1874115 RepID=A0A4U0H9X7_9SPHI|nr:hypothetical protein [Sphingobacterium alkalisoli]TJY68707.1 hypothetical protein FAZ19_05485 [Sphingobacterium alkalisoli]GGH04652.1 hypothetical protein GCM10011418_00440 [Sphingobacterium alkalisoli]
MGHSFHIPVLGLAFSIDSPIKVAKFGISSVISIVDDELIERMRKYYSELHGKSYAAIVKTSHDARARRITSYLDLIQDLIDEQVVRLHSAELDQDHELNQYFKLLPDDSDTKMLYQAIKKEKNDKDRKNKTHALKQQMIVGDIDVNIMSKVDKINFDKKGAALEDQYSDASAALRGFANSKLSSSVILSAGMNPRLYSYLAELKQFLPDHAGKFLKKITLKVSDYRSAFIQAKFLAKKGVWISEFRIESGLNCGGHAFATEGFLLGPILEEFKSQRENLIHELFPIYRHALAEKGVQIDYVPEIKYTVQGGIGTAAEQRFLLDYYGLNRTGWGSPFLLVPEATTVDAHTLNTLSTSEKEDFYISGASPLGVPFNNFRKSTAEQKRLQRIAQDRPGSPCTKKYLISNTEFTEEPICTASRKYQFKKLQELELKNLDIAVYKKEYEKITEKVCLCDGLAAAAYLKYDIFRPKESKAVAICPGPNTAYFKGPYSLIEMVDHIYGRRDLLDGVKRPSLFINELNLYVDYIRTYVENNLNDVNDKKEKYLNKFKQQLHEGIDYYKNLKDKVSALSNNVKQDLLTQLTEAEKQLKSIEFISKKELSEGIH